LSATSRRARTSLKTRITCLGRTGWSSH
jgi:hypothetical protein